MAKKRILIFAHYYAPDVASTGQLLQDLAEGMTDIFDVTVVCVVPSYTGIIPPEYQEKKIYREELNGVHILRVSVPAFRKSSKVSRIRNLAAYLIGAANITRNLSRKENFDYVFTISQPPILGGMLGVFAKDRLHARDGSHPKLIYNIQDFNPEQIEATGFFRNKAILGILRWLDKQSCRRSDLVITVGRDLVETMEQRFEGKPLPKTIMINNWINEKEIYPLPPDDPGVKAFREQWGLKDKFVFMYSGNIGLYYDLEGLLGVIAGFKGAKSADGRDAVFAFVGQGSVLDKLKNYAVKNGLGNVVFIPYQERDKLIYSLNSADVHFCVNAKGIKGVSCPSKFYGICGVAKPVLGVLEEGSEVQMLINESGCGLCCEPGNYQQIAENICWFLENSHDPKVKSMGENGHDFLRTHLTKDVSVSHYIKVIETL